MTMLRKLNDFEFLMTKQISNIDYTSNNKRIAKNTILLYVRMIVVMAVTIYTSRIVLDLLGAEDYGINNIISGVIVLFSFLNTALLTATQRFLNYYIGTGEDKKVNTIFCMSMNTYLILSVIVLLLGETIGLWFVNTQLNIPENRIYAAQWVYQLTLFQFVFNLIKIPYNASIISYERMDFYAYVSLFEVLAKLITCYVLYVTTFDRLITISILHSMIPVVMLIIYYIFCNRTLKTTRYRPFWDNKIFKEIFSFSGWTLFGSLANLSAQQGLNILLNIFYGVTVNAAAGIANQVTHAVNNLVSNFQMAYNPQITKAYASNEKERLNNLIIQTSKFAYYLMAIIAIPLFICIDGILNIWLVEVPQYTNTFCQLILVFLLMDAVMMPMVFAVQATGKIRNYQLIMSAVIFLNFPAAYYLLKIGMPPYCVWYVRIAINVIVYFVRVIFLNKVISFPIVCYIKNTLSPIILVTILTLPIPVALNFILPHSDIHYLAICLMTVIASLLCIYCVGLSKSEKDMVKSALARKIPFLNKYR